LASAAAAPSLPPAAGLGAACLQASPCNTHHQHQKREQAQAHGQAPTCRQICLPCSIQHDRALHSDKKKITLKQRHLCRASVVSCMLYYAHQLQSQTQPTGQVKHRYNLHTLTCAEASPLTAPAVQQ
jgi:hypothetical protein